MKIERFKEYLCEVKFRPEYNGNKVRLDLLYLSGKQFVFRVIWMMDKDDNYPNEFALEIVDRKENKEVFRNGDGILWIAEGDLKIIKEIED